jgi:NhaA family Na+:H+ antiporter
MAIPARPKHDPKRFADLFEKLLERYRAGFETGQPLLQNEQARSTLQTIEDGVQGVVPPLQRLEYKLHTPRASCDTAVCRVLRQDTAGSREHTTGCA